MKAKLLYIILTIFFILTINQPFAFSATHTCKCKFDTGEYEATGYFAGTCSYTMDETRKKCQLRRAEDYQDIKRSLIRYDVFGDPMELQLKILPLWAQARNGFTRYSGCALCFKDFKSSNPAVEYLV